MKKIVPLCLCAVLLFALASCRGVAERPFNASDFISESATVVEQSAAHVILDFYGVTLKAVVDFYELRLAFVGSKQIRLDDTDEKFWDYTGTYGEKHVIKITMRVAEDRIRVMINYLDELGQP